MADDQSHLADRGSKIAAIHAIHLIPTADWHVSLGRKAIDAGVVVDIRPPGQFAEAVPVNLNLPESGAFGIGG